MMAESTNKGTVNDVLNRLARRHEISIIAARDIGSRAWNLASERVNTFIREIVT